MSLSDLTLSHSLRDLTPHEERGEEILENSRLEKTAEAYQRLPVKVAVGTSILRLTQGQGCPGELGAAPGAPLEGAWRLGRAHLAQKQDQRRQEQDCEEQEESDPGIEVGSFT